MSVRDIPSVIAGNRSEASPEFDVDAYLDRRDRDWSFIMVEFGHGPRPAAFRQPVGFTGQRAYIGIEPWLYRPRPSEKYEMQILQAEHAGENISFIDQDLDINGNRIQRILSRIIRPLGGVGLYDVSSVLPDEAADEILLSNVFGDRNFFASKERTQRLLHETNRLLAMQSVMVIRETMTPLEARRSLTEEVLQNAGLEIVGDCTPADQAWESLEAVYGSGRTFKAAAEQRFYQFLTKTTESSAGEPHI